MPSAISDLSPEIELNMKTDICLPVLVQIVCLFVALAFWLGGGWERQTSAVKSQAFIADCSSVYSTGEGCDELRIFFYYLKNCVEICF